MRRCSLLLTVLAAPLCLAAPADQGTASHKTHIRLAEIRLTGGYISGAYLPPYMRYGPWPYGWAAWDWYPLFYHPGYYNGFVQGPGMGEIRLRTAARNAEVYLDGAYAGRATDLKTMWLEPGAYNLEVKANNAAFQRRVYVLSGKTLKVKASLSGAEDGNP